jgi:hypothetical protein
MQVQRATSSDMMKSDEEAQVRRYRRTLSDTECGSFTVSEGNRCWLIALYPRHELVSPGNVSFESKIGREA